MTTSQRKAAIAMRRLPAPKQLIAAQSIVDALLMLDAPQDAILAAYATEQSKQRHADNLVEKALIKSSQGRLPG